MEYLDGSTAYALPEALVQCAGRCGEWFHPDELVTVCGQYVCDDCLADFCKRESKEEDNIRGFLQEKEAQYLKWLWDGDAFVTEGDKQEALRQWYKVWAPWHPELVENAEHDFIDSCPGEMDDYLKGL